jgi:hypothetical protein
VQEGDRGLHVGGRVQLCEGKISEFGDDHEEVEPAFLGAHIGNIDVKLTIGVMLEMAASPSCRQRCREGG